MHVCNVYEIIWKYINYCTHKCLKTIIFIYLVSSEILKLFKKSIIEYKRENILIINKKFSIRKLKLKLKSLY